MARGAARPLSAIAASIRRPSSPQSSVKSRRVQRWMLGVDHQGSGRARVSGIRPRLRSEARTRQWPKLGKETMARSASRSRSDSTLRGWRTACSVWDRIA